jgi:hypothetical protein
LITSFISVTAVDETQELDDNPDDVIDFSSFEKTDQKPDIDIILVKFYREEGSRTVELTLEVNEKGNIISSETSLYNIILTTSESVYDVIYGAGDCTLNGEETDCVINGNIFSVTFDLDTSYETFDLISAETAEYSDEGIFFDSAPDYFTLDVSIDAPSEGKIGEMIDLSGIVDGGTAPYDWEWDLGDGNFSSGQNLTHVYTEAGTYDIQLAVLDSEDNGGVEIFSITITNGVNKSEDKNNQKESSDSGLIIFVGLIVIIVIAGVAVLVYVLRR